MKTKGFHNTLKLNFDEVQPLEEKAQSLQDKVLTFFAEHKMQGFTPWDVHKAFDAVYLIGSIRRSITNLTEAGYLIKTNQKVLECQAVINFKWIYNQNKK